MKVYEILMRMENGRVMATHLEYGVPNCRVFQADYPEGAVVVKIPAHYVGGSKVPAIFQVLDVTEIIDRWRFKGQVLVELPAKAPRDPLSQPILDILQKTPEATA